MPRDWVRSERDAASSLKLPWILFGITLVIAAAVSMCAVLIWVVRGITDQELRDQVRTAQNELATARAQVEELRLVSVSAKESEVRIQELEERALATETELAKARREVQATRDKLLQEISASNDPGALPNASLKDILGQGATFSLRFTFPNNKDQELVSAVRLENYIRGLLIELGLGTEQASGTVIEIDFSMAPLPDKIVVVMVSVSVKQPWRVPGAETSHPIAIWNKSHFGASTQAAAATASERVVREIIEQLARDVNM